MPLKTRAVKRTSLTSRPRFPTRLAMRLSGGSKRRFLPEERAAAQRRKAEVRDFRFEGWKGIAKDKGIDVSNVSTREQLGTAIRQAVFPTDERGRRKESSVNPHDAKSLHVILKQIEG